jgi:hypothetical protein
MARPAELLSRCSLPFEVISILLLAAILRRVDPQQDQTG